MWRVWGVGLLLLAGQACGSEAVGCKARLQAVNELLLFARADNNAGQVAGLEQAARNLKTNCSDGALQMDQLRVNQQRDEVNQRLLALQEARVGGNPEQIARAQGQLAVSQTRLLAAQRELDDLLRPINQ